MAGIGNKLKDIGGKAEKVGKTLTTHVTLPLVAAGTVGVKKFADVDKTMQLTNATMGNSADQAKVLNDAMKTAAANSTFGMNDAAQATLNFARAGLDAEQAASTLAPAMNLAAGEGGNLDTVSAGLVATINGFGDSFDRAGSYADVFANACNNSALDIDSLSNSMSIAAPIFSAAGYGVKDAALYMGVMANAGIDANVAANSLKTGMARLVSPSKQGAEWMDKLGISITNADGSMKDSVTVQKELHDAFAGLSESEQIAAASAIFGKNQMSNWLALINTAPDDVDALSTSIDKEGTTAEMAEAMMSGFGGSLEKLKSSIDVAATSFGEALAPTISKVADVIQNLVDKFNSLTPAQQQTIAKIAMLVAAVGPLLTIGGKAMTMVVNLMTSSSALVTKLGSFGGIAAIIIAALIAMYQNSEAFRNAVNNLVGTALSSLKTIFEALRPAIDAVKEAVGTVAEAMGNAMAPMVDVLTVALKALTPILKLLVTVFAAVVTVIAQVVAAVAETYMWYNDKLMTVFKAIIEKLKEVGAWFKDLASKVSGAWNTIKASTEAAWESVKNKIAGVVNNITSKWNALKATAASVWEGIKNAIISPNQTASDKIKGILDKIKGFFPIKVGKILSNIKLPHFTISGKFSIAPPSMPKIGVNWYAKGGIFDIPSVIGVGEGNEPEAVTPISTLKGYIADAVTNASNAAPAGGLDSLANALSAGLAMNNAPAGGEYTFIVELGGARVAEQVFKLNREGEMIMRGA